MCGDVDSAKMRTDLPALDIVEHRGGRSAQRAVVAQELLRDQALHTFHAKDLTVGSKVYEIGDITVQQDGVKVQLK